MARQHVFLISFPGGLHTNKIDQCSAIHNKNFINMEGEDQPATSQISWMGQPIDQAHDEAMPLVNGPRYL